MQKRNTKTPTVTVIGTVPGSGEGGISTALPGYLEALNRANVSHEFIASHEGGTAIHKFLVFAKAFGSIGKAISTRRTRHQDQILYIHIGPWFSMLRKLCLVLPGKFMGAKIICHVHSPSLDRYLNSTLGRILCKMYFLQMDRVLVLTDWWHRRLEDAGIANPVVVPNPLSLEFERVARKTLLDNPIECTNNQVRILTMARLVPGKGLALVLQSLVHLPLNYQLTIAGSGPLRTDLEQLVRSLGLMDRVSFLGWVAGEKRLSLFETHDVFVLPSQNDSFGMGFIEAMAYGLPVVALNFGAIPDVVPNNRAGFLIDKPDAYLLAEALNRLESASVRRDMGNQGKQWVLEQFSIDSVATKLKSVVHSLLKEVDS